jgi:hypothetical protein
MPVIGGGCGDRVDILVFQQLSNVGIGGDFFAGSLPFTIQNTLVDITDRYHSHTRKFAEQSQVEAPLTAKSDNGDADVTVRSQSAGVRRQRQAASGGESSRQERPS